MSADKVEREALQLDARSRARLAGRLLESLENLSAEENAQLWAEEALRRDAESDDAFRPAVDVVRDARAKLK